MIQKHYDREKWSLKHQSLAYAHQIRSQLIENTMKTLEILFSHLSKPQKISFCNLPKAKAAIYRSTDERTEICHAATKNVIWLQTTPEDFGLSRCRLCRPDDIFHLKVTKTQVWSLTISMYGNIKHIAYTCERYISIRCQFTENWKDKF